MITATLSLDTQAEILRKLSATYTDLSDATIEIIGQEKDGRILFSFVARGSSDTEVTHVGVLDIGTKSVKVVFQHDAKVVVSNCTINQESNFLGLVTVEERLASDGAENSPKPCYMFRAFLVEIEPQKRMYDLNLETPTGIRLQFLYGKYRCRSSSRHAHMLVFLQRQSIGMYHIPVARADNSVIMSGQPQTVQLVGKFAWSQWDCVNQRLYTIQSSKHTTGRTSTNTSTKRGPQQHTVFTGYQFNLQVELDKMIEVPVDITLPSQKTTVRPSCVKTGTNLIVTEASLNIQVLTSSNGALCVCHQHPLPAMRRNSADNYNFAAVGYSIHMVHHGKALICEGPKLARKLLKKCHLFFANIGDHILVHWSGYFSHLLNVSPEFEPGLHLFNQDEDFCECQCDGVTPVSESSRLTPVLTPRAVVLHHTGCGALDMSSGKVYRLNVDDDALHHVFASTPSLGIKLAVLNYAILHYGDLALIRKLFVTVCEDVAHPEVVSVISEFLLGAAYSWCRRYLDKAYLLCLPYSTHQPYTTLVETCEDGCPMATVGYQTCSEPTYIAPLGEDKSRPNIGLWPMLMYNIQEQRAERFSRVKHTERQQQQHLEDSTLIKKTSQPQKPLSFFERLMNFKKSRSSPSGPSSSTGSNSIEAGVSGARPRARSQSELILGDPPPFLRDTSAPLEPDQKALMNKNIELLTDHLMQRKKQESKAKLRSIATEYANCQVQQCRLQIHIVWSILAEGVPENAPLNTRATDSEQCLFQFLERLYLAVQRLYFPLPPGFMLYFTSLAFRTLNFRMFMEYVDSEVLKLSQEFVSQLVEELDDGDDNVKIKLETVQKLQKDEQLEVLQQWDHPVCHHYLARLYTTACLHPEVAEDWVFLPSFTRTSSASSSQQGAQTSSTQSSFPPLQSFMAALHKADPGLASGDRSIGTLNITSKFLEDSALVQWQKEMVEQRCSHYFPMQLEQDFV